MHYYGTRLSENISRREPEGYLLCLNVPVARTGTQEYLPEELGLSGGGSGRLVEVYRPEAEVFSPETIASFEGMPVTNDHPPEGVDIGNIRALQKGHAHNVRRGAGEDADLLLADLIITDPVLIDLILGGKREISCGYTYELAEENGQYIQRRIRGNHVAVVDAGRAGPRVCIKDEEPSGSPIRGTAPMLQPSKVPRPSAAADQSRCADGPRSSTETPTISERSNHPMKKSLVKKLVRMAKDGDPEAIEAVAELLETLTDGEASAPAEAAADAVADPAPAVVAAAAAAAEEPAAVVETPEATIVVDEATLGDVLSRLDQIIALLTPAAADEDPADPVDPVEEIVEAVGEAVEETVAEAAAEEPELLEAPAAASPAEVAAMVEEIMEPVLSEVLEPEDPPAEADCGDPVQTVASADALRAALAAVRPALARLPQKQRRKVAEDIAARLRRASGRNVADSKTYAALANAARRGPAAVTADLGRQIMAARNANYRK